MKVNGLLELLFQPLDCRLEMCPLLDKFLLLVDSINFILVLFLDILSVYLNDLGLQFLVLLELIKTYIQRVVIHVAHVVLE